MFNKMRYLKQYVPWLIVILLIESFTAMLLWLADIHRFYALIPLLMLTTFMVFIIISKVLIKLETKKEETLKIFLLNPNKQTENNLIQVYGHDKKEMISHLANMIYSQQNEVEKTHNLLHDYENYVEMWAHEIKLPISLLTLILDNQSEDLSISLKFKLEYLRNQINHQVMQMMYYYRVRSDRKDYLLENINLRECIEDILADFEPLLKEKSFTVTINDLVSDVFTDRRSLIFIIGQIISNAIKYSQASPCLTIFESIEDDSIALHFKDNGQGVKACDLPYIFDKGFTGDNKTTATGMGLFLLHQLCLDLNIRTKVVTQWQAGFEIILYL